MVIHSVACGNICIVCVAADASPSSRLSARFDPPRPAETAIEVRRAPSYLIPRRETSCRSPENQFPATPPLLSLSLSLSPSCNPETRTALSESGKGQIGEAELRRATTSLPSQRAVLAVTAPGVTR
jgi:hypothetical protein